jgi:hypothetical protein
MFIWADEENEIFDTDKVDDGIVTTVWQVNRSDVE